MTALEVVTRHIDALKAAPAGDVHDQLSRALPQFRFVPKAERRALADSFVAWATEHAAGAPLALAAALFVQAIDRFINEALEDALPLLVRARAIFAQHEDPEGLGLCAMLIGAVYRTFGNFDLALKTLWEGHELLKSSGRYPIFVAANANSMANIDLELGHLDEALAMFTVTLDESTKADDFYFMIYGLHGLARVYVKQGRRDEAEAMFHRALDLAERHEHPLQISNSLTELATLHFDAGDLDDAEALTRRALDMREANHLLGGAVTNCVRLAEIHCKRSQWSEALAILARGLTIADELHVKPKIAQVHQLLASVHERMGDAATGLAHYRKFHELREQVEREDSARKLADAKLIFDAEQTRKENAVIKAQKAEIERKNVELQDTIDELTRARISRKARAITFAIGVVLFIFQDAILGTALRLLASDNYFLLLGVKMVIIFSLAPINKAIEGYLFRRVVRNGRAAVRTA